jgi:hypothetical protein
MFRIGLITYLGGCYPFFENLIDFGSSGKVKEGGRESLSIGLASSISV